MTLVQLEYIVALDNYRSFILAAEKSFVTQPTLSMQLQKLEEELGVLLFDRSRQPVVPTDIGAEVIMQARQILKETGRLREIISDFKNETKGDLKVGVIPTIAPYLLPGVIVSFLKKYPEVHLQIWEMTTEDILSGLKHSNLDCGILATPVFDTSVSITPLFYENFVTYLSKSSSLTGKKTVSSADIQAEDVWLLNEGHCMRNQAMSICNQQSTGRQNLEYNTGSIETLKRMVDLNKGITILPELSIAGFSAKELERVRYFKDPEPVREISLATHRNFLKKKLIRTLEEVILDNIPSKMKSMKKKDIISTSM